MPNQPTKILYPVIILVLFLGLNLITPTRTMAQSTGGGGGNSGAQAITTRQNLDLDETKKEEAELARLQKDDEKLCKAQASSYSSGAGTSANGAGRPGNTPEPGQPQTYGESTAAEQTNRDALAAAGIGVNKGPCNGLPYQQVSGGCTDLAGLPQHSVDRLGEINRDIGGGLIVTGGTEGGHSAHAPGNNVVDLGISENLNNYVGNHSVSNWNGSLGTYYRLDNGDVFLRESNPPHWHARLEGTTGSTQAAFNEIGKFFSQATKDFRKILANNFLAKKVFAQNLDLNKIVDLGGTPYDLNQITVQQLNTAVTSLSPDQIRTSFTQMSADNLQQVVATLPFDGVNTVFANLDQNALNSIIPNLGAGNLNNIVGNLAYESVDNIVGNLGSGQLNNLLGSMSQGGLNTLLGSVYNGDILNNIVGNLSSDVLGNVLGQLGGGALNNVFGNLSGDVLNNLVGNLGMDSLNNVFGQLGGSALNQVLGGLNNNIAQTVFSVLGDGALNNIMNNGLSSVVDNLMSKLPSSLLTDIVNGLSLGSGLDFLREALGDLPGLSEVLNNIPIVGTLLGGGDLTQAATQLVTSAAGIGGLYVPVVEQNGQLMTLAKSTDKTTKEIKDLNIQICTHLRALHRIQARMELKNVEDANVMRLRSTEIEKYRQALYGDNGLIKKGGSRIDAEGNEKKDSPLYIEDTTGFWMEQRDEAERIAYSEIASSSDNADIGVILANLRGDNSLSLESNITPDDLSTLTRSDTGTTYAKAKSLLSQRIPIISSLLSYLGKPLAFLTGKSVFALDNNVNQTSTGSSEEYWDSLKKLAEPRNNRFGSYLIAADQIENRKNTAVQAARDEAIQGQGFLGVRTCAIKTADGKDCAVWKTVEPGIIIKEATAAAANTRLTQYENAKNMGELANGNEPNVIELMTNKPAPGGGGAIGPGMTSANQISASIQNMSSGAGTNPANPTETGDTGGNDSSAESALGNLGIGDMISNLFNSSDNPSLSSNGELQAIINTLKQTLSFVWNLLKPMVVVGSKAKEDGADLLYWYSPNASGCATTNNWPDAKSEGGVALTSGQNLSGSEGSLLIKATTTTQYKLKCTNNNGDSKEKTIEINK